MLELAILLFATGLVYALALGLAWLIGRFLPVPKPYRAALPWFLFQLYLVAGLFLTGDLPGAPRATLRLSALAAGLSFAFGLAAYLRRRDQAPWMVALGSWLLAGLLPWAAALLAEVADQSRIFPM